MKILHVSFDDVWRCLHEISVQPRASAFEQPFLAALRALHQETGAVFTLYCFNRTAKEPAYDIVRLPACYAQELAACRHWLRFGFHAQDDQANYGDGLDGANTSGVPTGDCSADVAAAYAHFVDAILAATGTAACIDPVVRLGFFAGTAANVRALQAQGITGLLAADDARRSYHLTWQQCEALRQQGALTVEGLRLYPSQMRLERVTDAAQYTAALSAAPGEALALFTHEHACTPQVMQHLRHCLLWAKAQGHAFGFLG